MEPPEEDALSDLVVWMRQAVRSSAKNAPLAIPLDVVDSFLQSDFPLDPAGLADLIDLFDGENRNNCSRLDAHSFHCLLHILLRSTQCQSRERGFYIFLDFLRYLTFAGRSREKSTVATASRRHKALLGEKTLRGFLDNFLSGEDASARWCGLFVLEFIRNSDDNRRLLAAELTSSRSLHGVISGSDTCRRLIAGAIMQEMLSGRSKIDISRLLDDNRFTASDFPRGKVINSRWLQLFEDFASQGASGGLTSGYQRVETIQGIEAPSIEFRSKDYLISMAIGDDILTLTIIKDNQFRFVDISLRHIIQLDSQPDANVALDVRLDKNGYYVMDGVVERLAKFAIEFSNVDQQQAFYNAILRINQPSPASKDSGLGSAAIIFVGTDGDNEELDFVEHQTTTVQKVIRTRPFRSSSAFVPLPSQEDVWEGSAAFLREELNIPSRTKDKNKETETQVADSQRPNTMDVNAINPPAAVASGAIKTHAIDTIKETQEDNDKSAEVSNNVEQAAEKVVVDGEVEMGDAPEVEVSLPSLAQQALDLPLANDISLTDTQHHHVQAAEDHVDVITGEVSAVPPQETAEITKAPDSQGKSSNLRVAETAVVHEDMDSNGKQTDTTMTGEPVSKQAPVETASNTKLKRPHHKIIGSATRPTTVDWDQDLRVDEPEQDKDTSKSVKRQKKTPQPKGPPVKVPRSKPKPGPRSSGKKKKQQAEPLPLTPLLQPKATKAKPKRQSRQVTKTLTSSRPSRAAAGKAKQKLAFTNEYENAAYDLDDPIESSPQDESVSTGTNSNVTRDEARDGSRMSVSKDDTSLTALDREQGNKAGDSKPTTSERTSTTAAKHNLPHQEPEPEREPQPELDPENLPGASLQNSGLFETTDRSKELIIGDHGSVTSSVLENVITSSIGDDPTYGQDDTATVDDFDTTGITDPGTGKSLGKRLAEALANTGILSSDPTRDNGFINASDVSKLAPSDMRKPSDIRNGVSQISKHVSQFMSRQVAAGNQAVAAEAKLAQPGANDSSKSDESVADANETTTEGNGLVKERGNTTVGTDMYVPKPRGILKKTTTGKGYSGVEDHFRPTIRKNQIETTETNDILRPGSLNNKAKETNASKLDDDEHLPSAPTKNDKAQTARINEVDEVHQITSDSVQEVTEAEYLSQHASQPVPSQCRTVDENGSPQPLGKYVRKTELARSLLFAGSTSKHRNGDVESSSPYRVTIASDNSTSPYHGREEPCNESFPSDPPVRQPEMLSSTGSETRFLRSASLRKRASPRGKTRRAKKVTKLSRSIENRARSAFAQRLAAVKTTRVTRGLANVNKPVQQRPIFGEPLRKMVGRRSVDSDSEMSGSEADTLVQGKSSESFPSSDWLSSEQSITLVEPDASPESEWKKALRKTQKTSLDILLDTSNRLMRHLLDEEFAITSVVDTYKNGCDRMIDQLEQTHFMNLKECGAQLRRIQSEVTDHYARINNTLRKNEQEMSSLPTMKRLASAVRKRKKLLTQFDVFLKQYEIDETE